MENKNKETCIVLFIYIYIYISVKKKKRKVRDDLTHQFFLILLMAPKQINASRCYISLIDAYRQPFYVK